MEITIQDESSYKQNQINKWKVVKSGLYSYQNQYLSSVVKMLLTHKAQLSKSATNFDHCDDKHCY